MIWKTGPVDHVGTITTVSKCPNKDATYTRVCTQTTTIAAYVYTPGANNNSPGEKSSRLDYCFEYEAVGIRVVLYACRLRCVFRAMCHHE